MSGAANSVLFTRAAIMAVFLLRENRFPLLALTTAATPRPASHRSPALQRREPLKESVVQRHRLRLRSGSIAMPEYRRQCTSDRAAESALRNQAWRRIRWS